MVYTVTFNPAIDYFVRMKELKAGSINRSESEKLGLAKKDEIFELLKQL